MSLPRLLRVVSVAALLQGLAAGVSAVSLEDALPLPSRELFRESAHLVLARAFDNLYGCDVSRDLDLIVRTTSGVARRHDLQLLRKQIAGRAHNLIGIETDSDLHGLRMLKIEGQGRLDDHFIWHPDLRRVRRFSSAQRGDQVQGSDLTLEDLEFRRVELFDIMARSYATLRGERTHRVTVEPRTKGAYERANMYIAMDDYSLREIHFYRRGDRRPYKRMISPVEDVIQADGHTLPGRWNITDFGRETQTEVIFRKTRVNPELPNSLFSIRTLQSERPLPVPRR